MQAPVEPIALTWWRRRNFRPAAPWPPTTSDEEQTTLRFLASLLTSQAERDLARVNFGTLGRNTFRGPGYRNFDIALIKDTPFGSRGGAELGTVEFRAEFFNIFNFTNFGLPSNVVRGSGFGYISKTSGTSRQIQFSLKILF